MLLEADFDTALSNHFEFLRIERVQVTIHPGGRRPSRSLPDWSKSPSDRVLTFAGFYFASHKQ